MSQSWSSMRASDRDRDRVNEVLQTAFSEGRLQPEEYEHRMGRVLSASTYGELEQIVADLPGGQIFRQRPPAPRPGPPAQPGWGGAPAGAPPGYQPGPANPAGWAGPPVSIPPQLPGSKHATQALIAGLAGIVMGVTGVVAIILGHKALGELKRWGGDGYGQAVTGLVFGYFWTILWGLAWISAFLD